MCQFSSLRNIPIRQINAPHNSQIKKESKNPFFAAPSSGVLPVFSSVLLIVLLSSFFFFSYKSADASQLFRAKTLFIITRGHFQ